LMGRCFGSMSITLGERYESRNDDPREDTATSM